MSDATPTRDELAASRPDPPAVARRRFIAQLATDAISVAARLGVGAGVLREAVGEAVRPIGKDTTLDLSPQSATVGAPRSATALMLETPQSAPGEATSDDHGQVSPRMPYRLDHGALVLLDQRHLPEIVEYRCDDGPHVAQAIRDRVVSGATLVGQIVAYGVAVSVARVDGADLVRTHAELHRTVNVLRNARPAAVTVTRVLDRMMARYDAEREAGSEAIARALFEEAALVAEESAIASDRMARFGVGLFPWFSDRPTGVLTYSATGSLACGRVGTALEVIRVAHADGRALRVYLAETRPGLQAARLTAWELELAGIPYTLLTDTSAGWLMSTGQVDLLILGAERIASNGDTLNRVGAYPLAALAARHGIPSYVIGSSAMVDLSAADGSAMPSDLGDPEEVLRFAGRRIAPAGTAALNPTYDVTPAELIAAIVTEEGVCRAPYGPALAQAGHARAFYEVASN